MNKNEILKLLCSRLGQFGQLKVVAEVDYGRVEELCFLIKKILTTN